MAEKKEVLDYLRNLQKAAEIEAKINGVNIWVLLGAMAVVAWQLAGTSGTSRVWSDLEFLLRTLVAAEALHMLSWLIGRSGADREEIRYSRSNFVEIDSPFLVLLKGVLLLLPPAGLIMEAGKSVGTITLCLLAVAFVGLSVAAIAKPFLPALVSKEKFPKPDFGLTKRADAATDLFFAALFVAALTEQVLFVKASFAQFGMEDARHAVLIATLYMLLLIAISRRLQTNGIEWTYELETEVVIGAITPEVAVRRIESRRLGPRLQDVVDRFFDDLDRRLSGLDSMLVECKQKIEEAKQVPQEYPAERAARTKSASDGVATQLEELSADCREFGEYLKKLEQKAAGGRKAALEPVLASLKVRHEAYDDRIRTAKLEFKRLLG